MTEEWILDKVKPDYELQQVWIYFHEEYSGAKVRMLVDHHDAGDTWREISDKS